MTAAGWILLVSGAVLAVICFYSTIRVLLSEDGPMSATVRIYFAAIYLVSVFMYINFMISASYYSSMDFRYVLYLIPVEALMLGLNADRSGRLFRVVSEATVLIFAAATTAVYLLLRYAG